MDKITKAELKRIAGVQTDAALARWWKEWTGDGITQQAISKWGPEDAEIPSGRHWQVKALLAEKAG